jgi:hypothetical protein
MRWTLAVHATNASTGGRRSRGVLIPRCWYQILEKLTLLRDDGDKKPVSGETTKETVKTIRVRECRMIPARPWWYLLVWFYFFPREAAGALVHPAFPTPSSGEGTMDNSGVTRRGGEIVRLHSSSHSGAMRSTELWCAIAHRRIHFTKRFAA